MKSLVIRPDALQEGGTAGVVAEYSGGQEGESLIEWFISDEEVRLLCYGKADVVVVVWPRGYWLGDARPRIHAIF